MPFNAHCHRAAHYSYRSQQSVLDSPTASSCSLCHEGCTRATILETEHFSRRTRNPFLILTWLRMTDYLIKKKQEKLCTCNVTSRHLRQTIVVEKQWYYTFLCVCGWVWVHGHVLVLSRAQLYLSSMQRADAILAAAPGPPLHFSTWSHKRQNIKCAFFKFFL